MDAENHALHSVARRSSIDEHRRTFWELVQMDFAFRLLHNQPPGITSAADAWKVNMPWLSSGFDQAHKNSQAVPFLVRARIGFIIADYFQLLDSHEPCIQARVLEETHTLCRKVEAVYLELNIVSSTFKCVHIQEANEQSSTPTC